MKDTEATFLQLVRDNEASLRRICRIYGPDPESRRDLYQDILLQLWRGLPQFQGRARPSTWLYRVALNTALAKRRSRRNKPEAPLEDWHLQRPDSAPQPAHQAENAERLELLYQAIEYLSDIDKGLAMLYLDDLDHREIAQIMGMSENNVNVRLHRIRARLAEMGEEVTT